MDDQATSHRKAIKTILWRIILTAFLTVLAMAIILVLLVAYFGNSKKNAFTRSNSALVGKLEAADTITADKSKTNTIADDMGTCTDKVPDQ